MNGLYTILLLLLSNVFMTLAWYGHLKLSQTGISNHWPLVAVIAFSGGIVGNGIEHPVVFPFGKAALGYSGTIDIPAPFAPQKVHIP